jgi:hypothetical protein
MQNDDSQQYNNPENDLEYQLNTFWEDVDLGIDVETGTPTGMAYVPVFVMEDAVERLKRYQVIVENLTKVGNLLWMENLKKYGGRKIHQKETPSGSVNDKMFRNMTAFVNKLGDEITLDDAYVELVLSMVRIDQGDPTGLAQYLNKEDDLFDRLETGETNG